MNVDVGRDVRRLFRRVLAPGLGVEGLHHLGRLVDLLEGLVQVLGDGLVVLLLQVVQVLTDDAEHDVVVGADVTGLDEQALFQ